MSERSLSKTGILVLVIVLHSSRAFALQPLSTFVEGARTGNLDRRAAAETSVQRARDAVQAWTALGPTITARASYTRNEYATTVTLPAIGGAAPHVATITPIDQWDAQATVDLPLVDLGSWSRIGAAEANLASARAQIASTNESTEKLVAQTYTSIVAGEALLAASNDEVSVARANLDIVRTRRGAGTASDLDVERAASDVARGQQDVADAANTVATSRNALHSLTSVEPTDGTPVLADDLRGEPPLATFLPGADSVGAVRAAHADAIAARRTEQASYDALLPSVHATATEHATNATGFGTSPYWLVGAYVQLSWDLATLEGARSASSATRTKETREAKARLDAHDAVFNAWHLVEASIAKSRAARAQAASSAHAGELARTRYAAGTGTQLEVIQAARDAFSAEVSRIQADANLVYARAQLSIASGQSLTDGDAR